MTISCAHCGNTRFGLVRYRMGSHQFCTKVCKVAYRRISIIRSKRNQSWFEYLMQPS
jgi:hypothetical protein